MYDEDSMNMICLLNKPFVLPGVGTLHTLTIDEIVNVGMETYNKYLACLCITEEDIEENLELPEGSTITPFELIVFNCMNDEKFKNTILDGLSCFFKEPVEFYPESCIFIIGDFNDEKYIHHANFNFIIEILRFQNCISKNKQDVTKPKTEAQKKFLRELKKRRAKYRQKFKEDDGIFDIISAVCAKHPSVNLLNVGSLTIYQLIDQYKRLNMIDEYFINIESLLHGASSENVKITHWSSKKIS